MILIFQIFIIFFIIYFLYNYFYFIQLKEDLEIHSADYNGAQCSCSDDKSIKINKNGSFYCVPKNNFSKWSYCKPDENDPNTGVKQRGSGVKTFAQGDGEKCDLTTKINEQNVIIESEKCTPKNLHISYWNRAFENAGCNSNFFNTNFQKLETENQYVYNDKIYDNGVDFYNEFKNENWSYENINNWANQIYKNGEPICNLNWKGDEGNCRSQWEQNDTKKDFYVCNTNLAQCELKTLNKLETEMNPEIIDFVFDSNQDCDNNCKDLTVAVKQDFSHVNANINDPPNFKSGICINSKTNEEIWAGGPRELYYLCDGNIGMGKSGVKPVLINANLANKNDENISFPNLFSDKASALIKCTPSPPEFEGHPVDLIDHISYLAVNNMNLIDDSHTHYIPEWKNENNIKSWLNNNSNKTKQDIDFIPHPEMYGIGNSDRIDDVGIHNIQDRSNVSWHSEMIKSRGRSSTYITNNGKTSDSCKINDFEINPHTKKPWLNYFSKPKKHEKEYNDAGYINSDYCITGTHNKNDLNINNPLAFFENVDNPLWDLYNTDASGASNIYYNETQNNNLYNNNKNVTLKGWKVVPGFKNQIITNWKNKYEKGGNDKHEYNFSIQEIDILYNCDNTSDKLSELNHFLQWEGAYLHGKQNSPPYVTLNGFAKYNSQLTPQFNDYDPFTSLYNCAQACKDNDMCKFFTYNPGAGIGYFKGLGPASVYPSNSYPHTFHGSSLDNNNDDCEEFFNPFGSRSNSFYANNKKHLTKNNAKDMGCTWIGGIDDRNDSLENDKNFYPFHLLTDYWLDNIANCDVDGCKGFMEIPHDYIPDNDYNLTKSGSNPYSRVHNNEPIRFPSYFINNSTIRRNRFHSYGDNTNNIDIDIIKKCIYSNENDFNNCIKNEKNLKEQKQRKNCFLHDNNENNYNSIWSPEKYDNDNNDCRIGFLSDIVYNKNNIWPDIHETHQYVYYKDILENNINKAINVFKQLFHNNINNYELKQKIITDKIDNYLNPLINNKNNEFDELIHNINIEINNNHNNENSIKIQTPDLNDYNSYIELTKNLNIQINNKQNFNDIVEKLLKYINDYREAFNNFKNVEKSIYTNNYNIFNSIPSHANSMFQRYNNKINSNDYKSDEWNSDKLNKDISGDIMNDNTMFRDEHGPCLKYLAPPYVNELVKYYDSNTDDIIEKERNVALYQYYPRDGNENLLSISCDMMKNDNNNNNVTWNSISRRNSEHIKRNYDKHSGRCELFNYSVNNPKLYYNELPGTNNFIDPFLMSGVITNRNKNDGNSLTKNGKINSIAIKGRKKDSDYHPLGYDSTIEELENNKEILKLIDNNYVIYKNEENY